MKKKIAVALATLTSAMLPVITFAQGRTVTGIPAADCASGTFGLTHVICVVYGLIKIVIPVLILGAVAYFIWGIVQFIGSSDAEEKTAARGTMVHGIIGFAVILGLWGLVKILLTTFNVNNNMGPDTLPSF
jgi:hypothetical protein